MILGLTGPNAAGKGEVARILVAGGFETFSLSDEIREELKARGREPTRDAMIDEGRRLRTEHGLDVLARRAVARFTHGVNQVVDSIRNPEEVRFLKTRPGFFLLLDYVCGGDQTRYGLLVAVSGSVQNVMTYAGVALGVFCSVRLGKKTTAAAGCVSILTGVAAMSVFLAPCQPWLTQLPLRFHPYLSMIPGILMNLGLQGCTLMFASMTADICDEDERVTGLRREGAYAAMAGFLSKLAGVLMMGMSGLIPWLVGYHKAACAPTEAQLINMKWILIAAQGGIVLVALLFILLYPLTRDRALETRRVLDARKRAC